MNNLRDFDYDRAISKHKLSVDFTKFPHCFEPKLPQTFLSIFGDFGANKF